MSRVVLAMSGGVDSSVAAHLLRQAGHDVVGVFMRHGEPVAAECGTSSQAHSPLVIVNARPHHKQGCCSISDAQDARRVAESMDIPFYALDFQEEFGQIIDYFMAEYTAARTPNPCVMCNNWLKFGRLLDFANTMDAQYVATGHYARLVPSDDPSLPPALLRGIDEDKDQSYVLFGIERSLLSRMLLPVGAYSKPEIRQLAHALGLRVADKPDSQEICFVPDGDHASFIRNRPDHASTAGDIVTATGEIVGQHDGIERFTIGQRKGLGVAFGEPRFVVRIEPDTHRVVIGKREELGRAELTANRTNWLWSPPPTPVRCQAKIRYNSRLAPATLEVLPEFRLRLKFDELQFGVAPGQAVVCYDGDRVLGGGWIE